LACKTGEKLRLTETYGNANLVVQQSKNMNEPQDKSPAASASPQPAVTFQPVKFVHEKGSQFRTYHAAGVWGVVNAESEIHLNFYTEYPRLATGIINEVNPADGTYTGKFQMEGVTDPNYYVVVRDFQCGVVMSMESATRVRAVLDSFINAAQKMLADRKASAEEKK
jgi:hypothetical protein